MNKIEERKNHIRILTETYSTPDDPFTYQPHIIAVGNYLKPTQFVCYFNNVTYIFDEFLQALDCTFKVIFVYNYIYIRRNVDPYGNLSNKIFTKLN